MSQSRNKFRLIFPSLILLFMVAFPVLSCAQSRNIDDPASLLRMLDSDDSALLVDVREPDEYAAIHFEGSVNIPLKTLPGKLQELSGKNLVLICRTGRRSAAGAELASDLGFNNTLNFSTGFFGMLAWLAKNEQADPETARRLRGRFITAGPLAGLFTPSASVFAFSGGKVGLSSFAGKKPAVILFWRPGLPQDNAVFSSLAASMRNLKNTAFLPISMNDTQITHAADAAEKARYEGTLYIDSDGSASAAFTVSATPALFLLDKDGVMRAAGLPGPDQKLPFFRDNSFLDLAALADAGEPVPYPENEMYGNLRTPVELVGKQAPDFTLEDASGKQVSLKDYRGKNVVLIFWASFCPHCRDEITLLNEYNKTRGDGVAVLSVTMPPQPQQKAQFDEFVGGAALTFPVLMDPAGMASRKYFISTIPAWMVIDKNGIVKTVNTGYSENTVNIIKRTLEIR